MVRQEVMRPGDQRYLKLHHISTSWGSHQACPHILGGLVQGSNIPWVLIVVHYLKIGGGEKGNVLVSQHIVDST